MRSVLLCLLLLGCSTTTEEPAPVEVAAEPVEEAEPETIQVDPPPAPPEPRDWCSELLEAAPKAEVPDPFRIEFEEELRADLEEEFGFHPRGVTEGRKITVWLDLIGSPDEVHFTVLHEIGHLVDDECLAHEDRHSWMEHRGTEGVWSPRGNDPYFAPSEDFADAFAVCQGGDPRYWTTELAKPPGESGCERLHDLVGR